MVVELVVIGITGLLTSIISSIAGLGGGVVLLLVLNQFVPPTTANAIQGAIQMVANGSRAGFLRTDISWPVVGWASVLVIPASLLGVAVATALPEDVLRLTLAAFVLILAWRPDLLRLSPPGSKQPHEVRPMLLGVGAASGFLGATIGASGPMTSPFYRAATASHKAFVATAATIQVLSHTSKVVGFALEGFAIREHLPVIVVGISGVLIGSRIGTRLLDRIPASRLDLVFKAMLTVLTLRIVYSALT